MGAGVSCFSVSMFFTGGSAMSKSMPIAEKIDCYKVDGTLYRLASDVDVAEGYPHGSVTAVVGKRVAVLVPAVVPVEESEVA